MLFRASCVLGLWLLLPFVVQDAAPDKSLRSPEATKAFASINDKDAKQLVTTLAGPEMEGRRAGSRGAVKAAELIARTFQEAGLKGLGQDGSFQIPFHSEAIVAKSSACKLTITASAPVACELGTDFQPVIGTAGGEATGETAFVGYAARATEWAYDDFANVNVKGRVAICLWREPRAAKDGPFFKGKEITRYSSIREKAQAASTAGAVALLVVPDPLNTKEPGPLGHQLPWALQPMAGLRQALGDYQPTIPVATISIAVAEKILGRSMKDVQNAIDRAGKPQSFLGPKGTTVTVSAETRVDRIEMFNVAGVWEGGDPVLKDEFVLVGCHYDHDGELDDGKLHPGADDNASGTTGLLLLAKALAAGKPRLRRSLVLVAFSAEERGLLGSEAFARDEALKIDCIAALLQIDMIGRPKNGKVNVLGGTYSKDLLKSLKAAAALRPVKVTPDWDEGGGMTRELFHRSDQWSFVKRGAPALFLTTGLHEDYHKPTDTPDKIDCKFLAEVARLAFNFAQVVANDEKRPARVSVKGDR